MAILSFEEDLILLSYFHGAPQFILALAGKPTVLCTPVAGFIQGHVGVPRHVELLKKAGAEAPPEGRYIEFGIANVAGVLYQC